MSTGTLLHFRERDPLRPDTEDSVGAGFAFAAGAHVLLITALAFGVNWQSSEPVAASAELWSAVPQVAAPRAVEPPPAPPPPAPKPAPEPKVETPPPPPAPAPDPQIAIEKEKAKKKELKAQQDKEAEEKKVEEKKAQDAKRLADKAEADRKKKELERQTAQTEDQRKKQLERILGQAGATGAATSTGTAAHDAAPTASYRGKIVSAIRPNILLITTIDGNPQVEVEVRTGPDGTILSKRVTKPSASKEWDETVLRAIDRTNRLPPDENGRVPSPMTLVFRPLDF
ncbi:cell envelope integrity protein TolA [Rhizobacter sp. SG703]|uniref:cell envelope integrity protein TolA n=1 Tax=Rhizobacter sp. SG703 TaxID=2587140 RepID=UPI001446081A|nr:cell envelope integrity protein TolA [Rhizobacter sp. SG703]NKI96911.1 colicin import membrane protein [Rhizobacter sp. SG703]